MTAFIPDRIRVQEKQVPYFEDAGDEKIPGYDLRKPISFYQNGITEAIYRLGGTGVAFMPGKFGNRPGFQIQFNFAGIPGRIDCAGLPLRNHTARKEDQAKSQALFLVRNWLTAELHSAVYRPGSIALVPFLIGSGGKTVTEMLLESGQLPMLTDGGK